ncbi:MULTISPECIES: MFS transporter [unclassified Herbaspirillum]|uniref:MFS transporter n=1 Tax=unclassified Herbaspirillum TaxID=2624150 RepID=UPI001153E084|nr:MULTISPECIES: MFS transporter [unclassified Herbaspirillum]MBB5390619.1 FSR family fosmidomycin resistance protein-like MFS transporter [Herbaspirillum sp. SJZ102]TQK08894.1 FSR family fosmidomycin resistance protein-like MFS transporter [Herbaspirillum sp. SJZ130]TQK14419.1 FSR family fosmidomycin resistance protein-like MFS transporter [Herbaspirillum sp. SJZ106]
MTTDTTTAAPADTGATSLPPAGAAQPLVMSIILAAGGAHLINDMIQALLPSIYPMLKANYHLSFTQVGLITLTFQVTASLLQPWIGMYTDRHPQPWLLPSGAVATLVGIVMLSMVGSFPAFLLAAALIGIGSSTFHPEASRIARMASGGRFGLAQSTFQVGGNAGSAFGPLLAAAIVVPYGQGNVAWFVLLALLAIVVLSLVSGWYRRHLAANKGKARQRPAQALPASTVRRALLVLALLVFSKYFYMASFTSYFTFYLIDRFHLSVANSQLYLFLFLGAVAVGTFVGGPIGDKIGRKLVIWISILGAAPFALLLPHANLFWTGALSVVIGLVIASAFSAIVVYAQELVPGKVGMIAGVFFGLMFGFGGIGAALLGHLADLYGIAWVYGLCAFLPLAGLLTVLLPDLKEQRG